MRFFYCVKCLSKTKASDKVLSLKCDCGEWLLKFGVLQCKALDLGFVPEKKPRFRFVSVVTSSAVRETFERKYSGSFSSPGCWKKMPYVPEDLFDKQRRPFYLKQKYGEGK